MDNSCGLRDYRRKMYKAQRKNCYISKHFWFFFFSSHSAIGELSMWTCHSGVSQASYIYFPIVVEMTEHNLRLGWVLTCRFSHYQYIMAFTSKSIHLLHVWSLLKCNLFCCYHYYYYCYWKGAKPLKTMDSWENHCFHCLECRQGKTYYSLVFLLLLRWFSNHSKSIKKNPLWFSQWQHCHWRVSSSVKLSLK